MDAMNAIRETFFQECDEQLGELETGLLSMVEGAGDAETVNAVFRAVHSIKGGAGAFKLKTLVKFAHGFETTLDKIRNGQLSPDSAVLKTMLRAADLLADLVREARSGSTGDDARLDELLADLQSPLADTAPTATLREDSNPFEALGFQPLALCLDDDASPDNPDTPPDSEYVITFMPKPELYTSGNETTRLLRELCRLGDAQVECIDTELPLIADIDPEGAYLTWRIKLRSKEDLAAIKAVFEFVDDDCTLDISIITPLSTTADDPVNLESGAERVVDFSNQKLGEQQSAASIAGANDVRALHTSASVITPGASSKAGVDAIKAEAAANSNAQQSTIRVDLDRVDRLINLVGELVINQAMLSQRVHEAGFGIVPSVSAGLDDLEHLTRDIQESVMAIRAQPVRQLFQRMSRIVREVADATGKSVRLKTEGENAEVDRTVIERLADPLTHMIRNAVDHGLESPEVRLAAGKPEQGEVRLSAAHKSGRVVIEVCDDGAGIDRSRVKSIAIRKGLIPADAQLTDSELDNLLFLPGFSTAESVSSISGRGVGMDVVKRSIQALGGRISISSQPGRGSTFSMSLPLTLAVLDGMVVKVADQTLVIPLTSILETLKPKPSEVHGLGPDSHVIGIRGGFTPLIDVAVALGFRTTRSDPLSGVTLLVETGEGVRGALIVDAIQDQRQVVIKSLEANYGHVDGIAAATILGDGRIALILDADAIVSAVSRNNYPNEALLAIG